MSWQRINFEFRVLQRFPPSITITSTMSSIAAGLNSVLPAPKYASADDLVPTHASSRVLGHSDVERQQIVLKVLARLSLCEQLY